jgi:hypothetical protein
MNRISITKVHDASVPPDPGSPKHASVLPQILDRLEDPNAPPLEMIRLIAIEIASIVDGMQRNEEIGTPRSISKSPLEQVKALRLLSRTLLESNVPDSRDVLNIDGPKFRFVLDKICDCFTEALNRTMKQPSDGMVKGMIRREFRDLLAASEQDIRREIAKPDFSYVPEPEVPDR